MPGKMTIPMNIRIAGINYPCECVDEPEDSFPKNIVEHKIIGYNGPKLEDTGLNARKLSIKTIWRNENYSAHEKFLQAYIRNKSELIITHPVYGDIVGSISSAKAINAPREIDCAHILIEFTEYGEPQLHNSYLFLYGNIAANAPALVDDILEHSNRRIMGQFLNKIDSMKQVVGQVSSRVNLATAMANTVVDAALFPATIPGQFVEMAVRVVESANDNKEKLLQSPVATMNRIRFALLALCRNLEEFFEPSGGRIMADLIRSYQLFNECLMIAMLCDNVLSNPGRILFEDIETCVNSMRNFAKEIIVADRPGTTTLAQAVNETTNQSKEIMANLSRERVVEILQETTIFNVLLMNRIHRSRAEQVCRRNWIENPNKVRGRIIIPQSDY